MSHKPVLSQQIISGLEVQDGETFVDLTLGNAGHTKAILETGVQNLTVVGIDADQTATDAATKRLQQFTNHHMYIETTYFDSLAEILRKHNIHKIDKALADLGFRSDQVDQADRGFSFQKEAPLNMSFAADAEVTAEEIVNEWQEESLADIIYGFGEEKFARRIARAIVESRQQQAITTTVQLAEMSHSLHVVAEFIRRQKLFKHYVSQSTKNSSA
jgi:16S rRNA (cytosine1402-N4)-methyltransferase